MYTCLSQYARQLGDRHSVVWAQQTNECSNSSSSRRMHAQSYQLHVKPCACLHRVPNMSMLRSDCILGPAPAAFRRCVQQQWGLRGDLLRCVVIESQGRDTEDSCAMNHYKCFERVRWCTAWVEQGCFLGSHFLVGGRSHYDGCSRNVRIAASSSSWRGVNELFICGLFV